MDKIKEILKERGDRYGVFKEHAQICQDLKGVMNTVEGWTRLTSSQKQALEVIADKIARMLNGDPNYDDNWQDIIGYSQLVLDQIHEHEGQTKMDLSGEFYSRGTINDENIDYISDGSNWVHKSTQKGASIFNTLVFEIPKEGK